MVQLPSLEAKQIQLESAIAEALRNGLAKTFGDAPSPYALQVATEFAQNAAPGIASAITDYIGSLQINIPAAPQSSLVSPAGPVTGTVMVNDSMIMMG